MNLLKRIVISMIFIPLLIFLFYKSGWYLMFALGIITVLQNIELRTMVKQKSIDIPIIIVPLSLFILIAFSHLSFEYIILSLLSIIFFVLGKDLFLNKIEGSFKRVSTAYFSVFYTSVLLSTLARITRFEFGNLFIISLLALIWITDSAAYFVGMSMGKHRGIFPVSPKKSLEGFIGGFVFSMIASYFLYYFKFIPLREALFAGISTGIFGQIGDLFESMIKRDFGVKDSSNIIPGHGGILDRFDSLLIAAPIYYILLSIF
ncbi:MAG: phosphatidate cytidylyltransferase [Candidatus Cloacimonetes bacterium]|nr:phosphatidate cytidylyltransferase [Candidatus Cloacimonadota bacterium]